MPVLEERKVGIGKLMGEHYVQMTERNHDIGKRLYELRFEQALTQEELATKSGVHPVTISDIERGDRKASSKTTRKLAAGLGVAVSELNGS